MPRPYDDIFLYLTLLPFFFWDNPSQNSCIFCFYGTLIPFFVAQLHVFTTHVWSATPVCSQESIFSPLQVDWGLFSLMSLPTILIPFLVWFRSHSKYENFKAKKN